MSKIKGVVEYTNPVTGETRLVPEVYMEDDVGTNVGEWDVRWCKVCEEPFSCQASKPYKHCSRSCAYITFRTYKYTPSAKVCVVCHKEFTCKNLTATRIRDFEHQKTCSRSCANLMLREKVCAECGSPFLGSKVAKICSDECRSHRARGVTRARKWRQKNCPRAVSPQHHHKLKEQKEQDQ